MKRYTFTLRVRYEDHTERSDVFEIIYAENINDALLGLEEYMIINKFQWFKIERIRIDK